MTLGYFAKSDSWSRLYLILHNENWAYSGKSHFQLHYYMTGVPILPWRDFLILLFEDGKNIIRIKCNMPL